MTLLTTLNKEENNKDVVDDEYRLSFIKRLYEIQKEGSASIRDFYAAYDAQKKREDARRRQGKPTNSTM